MLIVPYKSYQNNLKKAINLKIYTENIVEISVLYNVILWLGRLSMLKELMGNFKNMTFGRSMQNLKQS